MRNLRVAAAQVGRIDRSTPRSDVLFRLIALLEDAAQKEVKLVVFPEITFTTFFPRYLLSDGPLQEFFEIEDPETGIVDSANIKPFFKRARELAIDVVIGYGEKTESAAYNTASYVSNDGRVVSKYRKLEKRYFKPGDLGFKAFRAPSLKSDGASQSPIIGIAICNDRRWAECWRVALKLCVLDNTVAWGPELWGTSKDISRNAARQNVMFQHKLVIQSHAYTNATFCIAAARCGWDDGKYELIAGSMIVDPEGHIVAESQTTEDELIYADIDLDACRQGKSTIFCFEKHRRTEHYALITEQTGVHEPPEPTF